MRLTLAPKHTLFFCACNSDELHVQLQALHAVDHLAANLPQAIRKLQVAKWRTRIQKNALLVLQKGLPEFFETCVRFHNYKHPFPATYGCGKYLQHVRHQRWQGCERCMSCTCNSGSALAKRYIVMLMDSTFGSNAALCKKSITVLCSNSAQHVGETQNEPSNANQTSKLT